MYLDQGAWLQMGLEDLLHATSVYEQLGLCTGIRLVVAAQQHDTWIQATNAKPSAPSSNGSIHIAR